MHKVNPIATIEASNSSVLLVDNDMHIKTKDTSQLPSNITKKRRVRIILGVVALACFVVALLPVSPIVSGIAISVSAGSLAFIINDVNGITKEWRKNKQEQKRKRQLKKLAKASKASNR